MSNIHQKLQYLGYISFERQKGRKAERRKRLKKLKWLKMPVTLDARRQTRRCQTLDVVLSFIR